MSVLITNDDSLAVPLADSEIEAICAHVLAAEGVADSAEVSFSWIGDDEMRALNAEWRGIDAPTDVLSFPIDDPFAEEEPQGMPLELGDILIDPLQIARQAPDFDNDDATECRLMLVHGLLHLLGYDHLEDEEAREMEAREEELLRELARMRGDDPDTVRIGPTTRHTQD